MYVIYNIQVILNKTHSFGSNKNAERDVMEMRSAVEHKESGSLETQRGLASILLEMIQIATPNDSSASRFDTKKLCITVGRNRKAY